MAHRSHALVGVLALIACAACGLEQGSRPGSGDASNARPPVGLLTEGSAFDRPGVREEVVKAVERVVRRRVLVLGAEASMDETDVRALAARLTKENHALARYDWREPRCAAHVDVLTAIERDVDAVYRVSLDYAEHWRPATDPELAQPGTRPEASAVVLRALHLVPAHRVREERLSGSIALVTFASAPPRRVPVSGTAQELEPSAFTARLDVGRVVAEAIADLPAPPVPQWDDVARRLVSAGCPFLALAVSETRLGTGAAHLAIKRAALAAVARSSERHAPAQPTKETAAKATLPEDGPIETPQANEERYACDALCTLHMVELCNNDRTLWSAHHVKWEGTPCGTRREESFLQECYRQQWLNGAYDKACMQPCEGGGRDRLLQLLQAAGCLRLAPS